MEPTIIAAMITAGAILVGGVVTAIVGPTLVDWIKRRTMGDSGGDEPVDALMEAEQQLADLPLEILPDPALLPQGSVMPLSRNFLFVGRENELKALAKNLKAGDTTAIGHRAIAAVTGLGGIGKSQLACEFVYRYGQYFEGGVFWLSFADASAIPSEVAACGGAAAMELHPDFGALALEVQVTTVMSAWRSKLPRLLVFDNCEDEKLLVQWQPPTGGCRMLLTSWRGSWSRALGVRPLRLDVLHREESISLLRQHRPDLPADDSDLDAIAEELGDLPLALELAGSYLANYRYAVTPARYLEELRTSELLQHRSLQSAKEISPTRHTQDVARTFALSYERLDAEDPVEDLTVALLDRAACFAPGEPIPRGLLLSTLNAAYDEPDSALQKEDALRKLTELGLLETEEAGALRMHRLVATFVRSMANEESAQAAVEAALANIVDTIIDEGIPASLVPLLPHLRALANASEDRKDKQAGILHYQLGRYLQMVGAYSEAQAYFEYDLAVRENLHGEEHPSTAGGFNNLANVLSNQGKYEEARKLHERALVVHEKIYGEEHPSTADSLNNLGVTLQRQGKYEEARKLHERALAVYEEVYGEEHPSTADSLSNLGVVLQLQGKHDPEVRRYYERALAVREEVYGEEHPSTANSLSNLANVLRNQGKHEEACKLHERALAVYEKIYGEEHPSTANSLNNLGITLHEQGKHDEARRYYERALAIYEKIHNEEHPVTDLLRQNLRILDKSQQRTRTGYWNKFFGNGHW